MRDSIHFSSRLLFLTFQACWLFGNVRIHAEVVSAEAVQSSSVGWSGYSRNFADYWSGDTQRVDWSRSGGSTSGLVLTSGLAFGDSSIDFDFTPTQPIELLDSYRAIETDTMAHISVPGDSTVAEEDASQSYDEPGEWYRVNANYATVLDLDDLEVGHGSAVAALDSEVSDDSFYINAFQHAITDTDPVVDDWSMVTAKSEIEFTAAYQLNEPARIEIAGNYSGSVELDVQFTLTDRDSGVVVYEQSVDYFDYRGEQVSFSFRGDFSPGIYDVQFLSYGYSSMDGAGEFDASGIGEFTVDFQATSLLKGDFDGSRAAKGPDLTVWESNYGQFGNQLTSIEDVLEAFKNDIVWQANYADDYNSDGEIDFFDYVVWLNLRIDGDADVDNDSDGTDFLAWQQSFLNQNNAELADWRSGYVLGLSTVDFDEDGDTDGVDFLARQTLLAAPQAIVSQVPEPCSGMILMSAVGLVLTRPRQVRR